MSYAVQFVEPARADRRCVGDRQHFSKHGEYRSQGRVDRRGDPAAGLWVYSLAFSGPQNGKGLTQGPAQARRWLGPSNVAAARQLSRNAASIVTSIRSRGTTAVLECVLATMPSWKTVASSVRCKFSARSQWVLPGLDSRTLRSSTRSSLANADSWRLHRSTASNASGLLMRAKRWTSSRAPS